MDVRVIDSDNSNTQKEKTTWRKQLFTAWLQLPKFSSWLAPCDEDKYKAKCKECNKVLVAGRSELKKYADT